MDHSAKKCHTSRSSLLLAYGPARGLGFASATYRKRKEKMKLTCTLILALFSLSCFGLNSGSFDGNSNYVIDYYPKFSNEELEAPNSGGASAIDHVEWAVFETVGCLRQGGEIGLVLLIAGQAPIFVPANVGPSSLLIAGPQEASKLFNVKSCKKHA